MNISVYAAVLVDVTTRVTRFWRISVWVQNHWKVNAKIAGFANSMLYINTERAQQSRGEDGYPTKNLRAQPTTWNIIATWYCCWFISHIPINPYYIPVSWLVLYPRVPRTLTLRHFDDFPWEIRAPCAKVNPPCCLVKFGVPSSNETWHWTIAHFKCRSMIFPLFVVDFPIKTNFVGIFPCHCFWSRIICFNWGAEVERLRRTNDALCQQAPVVFRKPLNHQ